MYSSCWIGKNLLFGHARDWMEIGKENNISTLLFVQQRLALAGETADALPLSFATMTAVREQH